MALGMLLIMLGVHHAPEITAVIFGFAVLILFIWARGNYIKNNKK